MITLCIDTAYKYLTCLLIKDDEILSSYSKECFKRQSEEVFLALENVFNEANLERSSIDSICISEGPGSYTGLRIGVSMAKGICYGRNLKLIAVPTLELLCVPVLLREIPEENALLCPMLDARRMEVYAGIYTRALKPVREISADIVDADTYKQYLEQHPVYFFGNGAKKCMETINHPNAHLIEGIEPLAKWMQPLAEKRLLSDQTEDVAYFVPYYLKDFVAKLPKKLL